MRMFRILLTNAWFKHVKPKEKKKLSKTVIKFAQRSIIKNAITNKPQSTCLIIHNFIYIKASDMLSMTLVVPVAFQSHLMSHHDVHHFHFHFHGHLSVLLFLLKWECVIFKSGVACESNDLINLKSM